MAKAKKKTTGELSPVKTENIKEQHIDIDVVIDVIRERIAETAYLKAEQRGFALGGEMNDWIEAEKEVLEKFSSRIVDEYRGIYTENSAVETGNSQGSGATEQSSVEPLLEEIREPPELSSGGSL